MRFRKLQIVWSVACGLACALLIALWVRSYWKCDVIRRPVSSTWGVTLDSLRGALVIEVFQHGDRTKGLLIEMGRGTVDATRVQVMTVNDTPIDSLRVFTFRRTRSYPITYLAVIPHWFPALAAAFIAAVPWMRWRFTLRTLLIATTLLATMLGLIVYATRIR